MMNKISPVRPVIWIPALLLILALIRSLSVQTLAADDAVTIQNVSISRAEIISRYKTEGESSITLSDEYTADLSLGTLTMPGAYLQASVTVKNENDFAVEIAEISQDSVFPEDLYFEVTAEEEDLDTIEAGSSAVFLVTAGWDSASTANLEYQEYAFRIVLTCTEGCVSLDVQTTDTDVQTDAEDAASSAKQTDTEVLSEAEDDAADSDASSTQTDTDVQTDAEDTASSAVQADTEVLSEAEDDAADSASSAVQADAGDEDADKNAQEADTAAAGGNILTGDSILTFLWVLLIICSAAGIVLILKGRRQKGQQKY